MYIKGDNRGETLEIRGIYTNFGFGVTDGHLKHMGFDRKIILKCILIYIRYDGVN
jgi:hypothetical protein